MEYDEEWEDELWADLRSERRIKGAVMVLREGRITVFLRMIVLLRSTSWQEYSDALILSFLGVGIPRNKWFLCPIRRISLDGAIRMEIRTLSRTLLFRAKLHNS